MGFEGIDYEIQADGTAVNLNPDNMQTIDKYHSVQPLYTGMLIMPDNFQIINPTIPQIWRDYCRINYETKDSLATGDEYWAYQDLDQYFWASDAKIRADAVTADFNNQYAAMIMAATDLDDLEDRWIQHCDDSRATMQDYMDELTEYKKGNGNYVNQRTR
jgi:putative aldouronate transport system substrate-binding protein